MSQLTKQTITLEFELERPIENLPDLVAGRGWTIEGVKSCNVVEAHERPSVVALAKAAKLQEAIRDSWMFAREFVIPAMTKD